tara:strand:+ start:30177 stop:30767 length:591 start_codon:yes stop_codon:yes gene_type:complete
VSQLSKNSYFFLKSSTSVKNLPDEYLNEYCFWGKSNVGKSSLLNSLTKLKLAKTSKTPGRTTTLNFFEIKNKIRFVDLPGYGYAKKSKQEIYAWNKLILDYLSIRKNIISIFLLIDSRHGLKEKDHEAVNLIRNFGLHFYFILTKVDKINNEELNTCYNKLKNFVNTYSEIDSKIFCTSSKKNVGIKELKNIILEL